MRNLWHPASRRTRFSLFLVQPPYSRSPDQLDKGVFQARFFALVVHELYFLAEQEMFLGKIKDPDKIIAEIDKVSASAIQKLAAEIFRPQNLNLAIIGPYNKKEEFEKILNKF